MLLISNRLISLFISTLVLAVSAQAQQPAIPPTGFAGLDQYRASRIAVFTDDYGQLARYRDANAALKPPAPGENRVVFFGDSITDIWKLEDYFPGKPYLNRGIGGQTTPQMLVRFRQDVIDLHPKVVVILAGTNDIAGNTGPMRLEDIEADYASMAELARANHIAVVFSSVLPVHNYTPKSQDFFAQRSPQKILALNRWLKRLLRRPPLWCISTTSPPWWTTKACSSETSPKTACTPTPPDSRSWPRWRRRRSAGRWRASHNLALRFACVHL